MLIAVLGWGSLVWDPRDLAIEGGWHIGGPKIPIEFSRISRGNSLTLVIDEEHGTPVYARHALSSFGALELAAENLRSREGMPCVERIGFWNFIENKHSGFAREHHPKTCDAIGEWARKMEFDAVIWTSLVPKFKKADQEIPFSLEAAVAHITSLSGLERSRAVEYIENAPPEVMTPVRLRPIELGLVSGMVRS